MSYHRYEVHDYKGNCIGARYADQATATTATAVASRVLTKGYLTLWWVNDWGCPNDLLGHATHGTFDLRPCRAGAK
jgi:hypothetical protein